MRRYITYIVVAVLFWSCDSEDGLNCTQKAGNIIQTEIEVAPFQKIIVRERVQLILKDGPISEVVLETGENLVSDITITSLNNTLSLKNDNGCNLVRDYGITKVYVTAPNISEIRNSSGLEIQSDGVLGYDSLTLISEDSENEDQFHIDGDFRLELDVNELVIASTGLSNFFLSGEVRIGNFGLFDGDGRVEAGDLKVRELEVFHRSTQKMIVYPVNALRGEIRGLGDIIAKNRPPFVNVEEFFTGTLIFDEE